MTLPKNNHSLLTEFANFLSESGLSSVSIKNYISDLRHFFGFLEVNGNPDLHSLYQNISKYTKEYQINQQDIFTPINTINRRLASIRRLTTYLKVTYFADTYEENNRVDQITSLATKAPSPTSSKKIIDQFNFFLKSEKKTHSTIKNYCSDLYHYFNWIAKHTPFNTHHLSQVLSKEQLNSYVSFLKLSQTTASVISRRQSSVKKLASFCHKQGYIDQNPFEYVQQDTKLSPLSWLKRYLPKPRNPSNAAKSLSALKQSNLAKAYYRYHQLPFTPYLHLALLVIATTTMALLAYNQIIKNAKPSLAGTSLVRPKRQLSFQGRLSDSVGTPIVTTVNVNFKLWDQLSGGTEGTCTGAGGEDCLYKTGTCSITPDNQGIFNTLIGDTVCGAEIPQSVFADNQNIYLEVGVGAETLTPRQQIATVGYALNSETLQGYPAANPATINSVPVIDNSGNINISATSPSIISTSGNFTLTGESLTLTTEVSSGGDITLQPDALGAGQVLAIGSTTTQDFFRVTNANLTSGSLISGYVGNDVATGSGNLLMLSSGATETAKFRVTADGRTTISTATVSAITAALTVDQNGTGDIFTGSASGITKFNIANSGAINVLDGVAHTINDVSGNLTLTSNSNTISLNDNVTFAGTTTLNGQTYTWPASAGSNTYVLQTNGSGTLSWVAQTGGGDSYWGQANGTLYPLNSTVDFLLGGQASSSAKFAVLNLNAGTPTATIAGTTANAALFYDGNGNISTTNRQSLVLGNSATYNTTGNILLNPNGTGNIGIGTTDPQAKLDIENSSGTSLQIDNSSTGQSLDINANSTTTENIVDISGTSLTSGNLLAMKSDTNRTAFSFSNSDQFIGGQTDQRTIATGTPVDTFVYDTSKDIDGGLWRNDDRGKASSWYNETIDNIGASCVVDTNDRCGTREFPAKAIIVATTTRIYIYDAKDNTLWMDFRKGSGTTEQMIGPTTNSTGSSLWALDGKIYYGNNGSVGGLYVIDFKNDKAIKYDATNDYLGNKTIDNRNSTFTWVAGPSAPIVNATINDVHARNINSKVYVVVGTDAGMSVINETDRTVYDYDDEVGAADNDYNSVWLDRDGNLWDLNETALQLDKWTNVIADIADENPGNPDSVWDESSTPALFASAQTINIAPSALFITDGTSTIDGKSPTIYAGHNGGLTAINTKANDETNGSVKYYTSTYITDEMIGDIRAMWPLNATVTSSDLEDISVKTNDLTATNIDSSDAANGVRRDSTDFDGSTENLSIANASDADLDFNSTENFTISAWVYPTTMAGSGEQDGIITKWDETSTLRGYRLVLTNDDADTTGNFKAEIYDESADQTITASSPNDSVAQNTWYHVVITFNGGTAGAAGDLKLYVDGVLLAQNTLNASFLGLEDVANDFVIGDYDATDVVAANTGFAGRIDDVLITAETITAGNILSLYNVGHKAIQNHTTSRITGVTGTDNYQRLMGNASGGTSTSNRVFAVSVDDSNQYIYAGLNDASANTGGLTAVGIDSDSAMDLYDSTANINKDDDLGTQFSANDVVAFSLSGTSCPAYNSGSTTCNNSSTLSILGTNDATYYNWMETSNLSLYSTLATLTSPEITKNEVNINSIFRIFNTYNNLSQSSTGESIYTPALSVDSNGNFIYNYLGTSTSTIAMDFNDSVLTTGTLADFSSTALTTGTLVNLNNSNTSATGNTLVVNHYGSDGYALRVNDEAADTTPFVIDETGNVGLGDTSPASLLTVGNGDLFQVNSSGIIASIDGVAHTIDDVSGNLTLTSNSNTISLNDNVTFAGTTTLNSLTYTWPASQNSNYILQTNGTGTLSWIDLNTAVTSYWSQANGALFPNNSTVDFLVGAQATDSAKFAVLNINSGTPVASISSGLSGVSSFLTADGILATTNNQTLTIGNSTTGNISIATGTKTVTVNSSTWDITGAGVASGLTGLSSSGTITFSGLSASSAVYTDGSSNLTSIAPTTGILGFWQRGSGSLAPWWVTDSVNIGSNATTSALVHLGGTTGESSFFMEPVAIGFNTALTNPGIGGGTTALQVDGDILPGVDDDAYLGRASTAWSRLYLSNGINNSAGTEQINITNRNLTGGQWNATSTFRVGDSTKSMPTGIEFYVVGDASVSATFTAGGNSRIIGALEVDGTVTVGGGTGKIDVGTVDPPYTINGEKYATYLSGMIGVKEETTGTIVTNEYLENIGYRKTINFNNQAKGSDLWLFSKTTNLKENLSRMSVLLTPNSQAKTWYEIDESKNTLYIYSSSPGNISYRFSAPRFDDAKWGNTRTSGVAGFVLSDDDSVVYQNNTNENINYSAQIEKINGQFALLINNQEKKDIANFSNSLIANLRSGLAVINELLADNLVIKNKLISPLADINELNAINATISGTLTADNIKGKTIDKLNEQLNIINDKYSTASAILSSIQNRLNQVENANLEENTSDDPLLLSPLSTTSAQLPEDLTNDNLTLQTLYVSDILANGSIFTQSLSSFETDLFIQPTGDKPVHILANLLNLYPNGQIVVAGDLIVTGNIFANNLDSRTATISGTLALGINNSPLATDSGKLLAVFGASGEEVSSIDASGSANFNTLKTSGLVIASQNVSDSSISGTITSNSTIGTATIATGSSEVFIQNNQINPQTLVYITPISNTNNQVMYVKSKQACDNQTDCISGFTVAVPNSLEKETSFNYWLVQTK